ncbi:hypothetical protein SDC9_180470 [bioreactor metagenome]|uniref:Uncharacterized protein n=1 Tax=bioreactor metagenome TaxID=1076179 RepID=A0A645H1T0_9ZZZZ
MTTDQPAIMFDFKKSRIRIHKNTLHALDNPAYVLLLINPIDRLIAVKANDGTDARAHRVGMRASKNKSFEIYSMALLDKLRLCSEWDEKQSYRILGNRIEEQDLVQFKINESFQYVNDRDESDEAGS